MDEPEKNDRIENPEPDPQSLPEEKEAKSEHVPEAKQEATISLTTANEFCLNCGTKLSGLFCFECGQKDISKRQTLGELWTNFISSFWSYEGKFFLTTKYLITKPGFLAIEYNAGKRESYYHPARMYVFISFVFFLLLFSLPKSDDEDADPNPMSEQDSQELKNGLEKAGLDSAGVFSLADTTRIKKKKKKSGFNLRASNYKSTKEYDSVQNALAEEKRDRWLSRKLNLRNIELNKRYQDNTKSFIEDFTASFMDNFSKVLFYLLPIFALLLKLFYIRKDFFYSEHLVFSIYYYNFFYLAASLKFLVDLVPWLSWADNLFVLWIFIYLLFAMKRMYAQSWGKTILKFSLFSFTFMLFLVFGLVLSAFAVLLMI